MCFTNSTNEVRDAITEAARAFDLSMRPGLIKGAGSFLKELHKLGYCLHLVTSSPKERVKILLELHNIHHVFKNIITGDDIVNGKPDPEPYLKMAELIQATPTDCVVFEDSDSGIQSALGAGMKVVTISNNNIVDEHILFNITDFSEMRAMPDCAGTVP